MAARILSVSVVGVETPAEFPLAAKSIILVFGITTLAVMLLTTITLNLVKLTVGVWVGVWEPNPYYGNGMVLPNLVKTR